MHRLTIILFKQGRREEAENMFMQIRKSYEKQLGQVCPHPLCGDMCDICDKIVRRGKVRRGWGPICTDREIEGNGAERNFTRFTAQLAASAMCAHWNQLYLGGISKDLKIVEEMCVKVVGEDEILKHVRMELQHMKDDERQSGIRSVCRS